MNHHLLSRITMCSLLFGIATGGICGADQTNVELIIDDSGSMAQRIQGKTKIQIAKEVLAGLVEDFPEDTSIAVRTYGSQKDYRLNDCSDMQLLVPLGPKRSDGIDKLEALQPKGMTAIAGSLEAAAKDFEGKAGDHNVVILLSDGEETCKGDPCAAAKALHEAGIRLEINVIGFDVEAKERGQLRCIADAGGGKYYDAANSGELKVVASAVKERIVEAAPKPEAAPAPFDLLAAANGGQVLAAPNDSLSKLISGDESGIEVAAGSEVVFAFKDEQVGTFDTITTLIPGTSGCNLNQFEVLAGNDSLSGPFTSLGTFQTQNTKLLKTPYQEFHFPTVAAKYLKVNFMSIHGSNCDIGLYQLRLPGKLGGTAPAAPTAQVVPPRLDLIAAADGGQVITAPDASLSKLISGDESGVDVARGSEVVFAFKDERSATFDTFSTLIPGTSLCNLNQFEMSAASDSPTGPFTSIGKFQTQNIKLLKTPYQEFHFPSVTAKYLKVNFMSNHGANCDIGLYQLRLLAKGN